MCSSITIADCSPFRDHAPGPESYYLAAPLHRRLPKLAKTWRMYLICRFTGPALRNSPRISPMPSTIHQLSRNPTSALHSMPPLPRQRLQTLTHMLVLQFVQGLDAGQVRRFAVTRVRQGDLQIASRCSTRRDQSLPLLLQQPLPLEQPYKQNCNRALPPLSLAATDTLMARD